MTKAVSIYMTIKNGIEHIEESVSSIKHQTFDDWEAIIVDDGSTDGSTKWLQNLASNDNRFTVVVTEGVGRAKALNMALCLCNGEYVANLDVDDLWHPKHLEVLYNIARLSDLDFICSNSRIFSESISWHTVSTQSINESQILLLNHFFLRTNPVCHSSVLIRNEVMRLCGGYDNARRSQIDLELWYRLIRRGVNIFKYDVVLVGKRIHANQSFENKKRLMYVFNYYRVKRQFLDEISAPIRYKFLAFATFLAGLLPEQVRRLIR